MKTLSIGLILGAGGLVWLGTSLAPARYQLVENRGVLVRLDQRSGAMDVFVMTTDATTGRVLVVSPEQAHDQRVQQSEAASRRAAALQTRLAPCLKTGKTHFDCEWEDVLWGAGSTPKR
jgi:hypothetical protein